MSTWCPPVRRIWCCSRQGPRRYRQRAARAELMLARNQIRASWQGNLARAILACGHRQNERRLVGAGPTALKVELVERQPPKCALSLTEQESEAARTGHEQVEHVLWRAG